jgi:phenylpropionate dioxygenase-like ring-hydroxylating dioxygenase large terminal subunit
MIKYFLFLLLLINNSFAFYNTVNINPLFNNWNCIGIKDNINFKKPYVYNVGELPLVLWKDNNDNLLSTLNICKHMGSKFDKGRIDENGCLECPYHGLPHDKNDKLGETIEYDGKIFWSYNPITKKPSSIPFEKNNNYNKVYLQIDMDGSLTDCAYNSMDLYHPEFVHNKIVGFGNRIPPKNIKSHKYINKLMKGLSFDYYSNKLMRTINNNMFVTKNFHMYHYPSFTWSRVSFDNDKKHLIVAVNFLPLKENKTRWFVTIYHNYMKDNPLQIEFVKLMAKTILFQDSEQMKLQAIENPLKKMAMFEYIFKSDTISSKMHNLFANYKYPNIDDCAILFNDYKKYI